MNAENSHEFRELTQMQAPFAPPQSNGPVSEKIKKGGGYPQNVQTSKN